ncbi:filamentous hemagglutinin N-terminal domain-containing protein [Fusobacterium nucleatum]|uniref:two-partner secretion domain-containing protein n=1 Tax=Fusobacterium nucleatum TaxID=851 RepID=UPI00308237DA
MIGRLKRLIAVFMLFLHVVSLADGIVPDSAASRNLQVDKAANGVPLVNIEAPDKNGTSHNVYKDFNVDKKGAILNNAKDLTNSQLGGLIYGNPNLQNSNEATTIINEVSGVNRSRIEGYQEIAGKRANYILANPNGIYINGAGFINTGNVTFTTGRGNNLLNPEKGMIEVAGKGLDLRNINKAELIARVAELSAPIYGGDEVNLKLGSKNNKPEYALDARALGSIYAGRINIIVNEDGVGVKTQAPMYATKGDVVISSRGKVYLKDTQAKGDIKISSAETEIGNKLLAENSVNIQNSKLSNKGQIQANNDIAITGNVDSSNLISTNKDITISGNLKNSGKILSKNINTKDLNNSGELYSENLTTTNLENSNKINIKENINSSNILNKTNNSEIISKNLNTSNLDNKGNVKIVNNVTSQEITNNGKLLVGNNLNAQNLANTSIIQGKVLNINNKINSSGKILSDSITTKDISNSGNISSKAITTQELTNSGEIISNSLSSNDVSNSKDIFVNGNLKVVNELNNNGVIEGLELNTNSIENTGNITIQNKLVAQKLNNKKNTANVNAGFLDVQNKVISIGNIKALAVKTKDLDNSGSILTNSLTTTESINKGNITSKDISTQNLVNSGDIKVGRNLNTDKLKNSKNIIAQNITIEKSLDNINGNISSLNTNINTSDIKNNNGIIQAVKNINIVTANDLNLDGKYTANDSLNINAKSLENNGDLENDGEIKFTLTGNLINNKKISSSGNLDITAKEISNNGTDSAIGSMTSLAITASSLKNEGNLLFGEGKENKLKTTGDINNTGVISSLGKLSIEAKDILNDKHIVSDNDLTVNANSITNKGLLYSTENMKVDFKNDFLNDRGEIYSGGDIAFTGKEGTFTNKVGDITSEGNIKIEAKDIKNLAEIKGYHKVVGSVPGNESNVDLSKIDMNKYYERSSRMMKEFYEKYVKKGRWTWFNNDHTGVYLEKADKIESHYTSEMSTIKADKNITLIATKDVENIESNILANGNININAQNLINKNFEIPVERKLIFLRDYEFHRPAENPGSRKTIDLTEGKVYMTGAWDKGSFIMDDKITTYLGTGKNAKISASGNINISANKVGNGALAKENVKIDSKKQDITSTKVDKNDINLDSIKNTNVDEIVLNKKNLEPKEEIDTKGYIILPKNDKGMFKINNNIDNKPGFSYLVETNINFIDKSRFYGSDYFFKRIGFNPDRNIRLLGDSFYETKLINRAILEGTGRRYLSGYVSEKEQMKALYDNAAIEQEDLKLSLGIALTKDQIAGLKKDIIWYVEEEIQGQKVLVPKVYLTRNTLSKLKNKNAAIEVGQNLVIAAKDIVNTGNLSANNIIITTDNLTNKSILGANKASIDGNSIAITAENSMNNIGADIKANENLVVTAKDISNLSTKRINGYEYDNISNLENSANIEGKNVTLTAKNDVVNTAASIKANESLKIEAKDVTINTLEENRYFYSGDGVKEYTKIDNKNNVSSDIEAKNIDITSKNDIDVKGSNIVAKEEANIKADGDINIVSATDSRYYAHKETHKKSFGRSKSEENISYATNNVSSNILGDKVNITSGKDVNILGSNVQANTEGEIKADRNMTQAGVKDINYSYHKTTKTGFMGLTSKSVTDENYAEKAILSATLS